MVEFNGMKETLVPIDQAGRIVLPKEVRDELAIKPGDTFKISIQGSAVTLTPNTQASGFVRRGKALVFSAAGKEAVTNETIGKILNAGREDRETLGAENLPARKR